MSFCQTCGSNLPDGVVACPACGATQGAAPAAAAPGPTPGYVPGPTPGYAPGPPAGYVPAAVAMPAAGAGLTPNAAGALAYVLGLITGILFLVIDPFKNDRFVRFHAFQSIFFHVLWIALSIAWTIVGLMLGALSHGLFIFIQVPVHLLLWLGGFCLWLYMMYSAYQGKMVQLPIIGALAAKQAGTGVVGGVGQRL